ncbi:MAG: holo-ACP synthase [Deltaproteobacteria bacterium]|nr:holo-ACP synthase [Deltaproteobacteria bacterium]
MHTGIDIASIERIKKASGNEKFLKRIFTDSELGYAFSKRLPFKNLAGRFAAKEACLKALTTGLARGLSWQDIEVYNEDDGRPHLRLRSEAKKLLGDRTAHLSISYSRELAIAFVAIE